MPRPTRRPSRRSGRGRRPARTVLAGVVLGALPAAAPPGAPAPEPRPAPAARVAPGVWPLDPRPVVAHRFAPPAQRWRAGHRGVDLVGRPGQAVRAALAGRVSFAGRVAGKPVVVLSHGGRRTTYEPVVGLVPVGTDVAPGARIGLLTVPFSHCYPDACLHWGLRRGEAYLDPLTLVGDARVRLLTPGGGT